MVQQLTTMKHFDTNMFAIKSNFEHNHLRTLILSTLIVFFTLLCSFLLMLMIINIYHHYQYTNDLSYNHDRHQQWYHHNQDEIKTNSIDGDPIDQQSTETSTPLSLITTLSSISSSSSSSPSSDLITDKHQG